MTKITTLRRKADREQLRVFAAKHTALLQLLCAVGGSQARLDARSEFEIPQRSPKGGVKLVVRLSVDVKRWWGPLVAQQRKSRKKADKSRISWHFNFSINTTHTLTLKALNAIINS